jgi:galactokinase
MAIARDTLIAVGIVDSPQPFVEMVNMNEKYPRRKFLHEDDGHVTIDPTIHEWSNYFKCGYKVLLPFSLIL